MEFWKTLQNNIRHDILGNFRMSRELGSMVAYGYLAKKTYALARAMIAGRTITVNNRQFFDTWNG